MSYFLPYPEAMPFSYTILSGALEAEIYNELTSMTEWYVKIVIILAEYILPVAFVPSLAFGFAYHLSDVQSSSGTYLTLL